MSPERHIAIAAEQMHKHAHQAAVAYMDDFLKLSCAPDLLAMRLYPNWKEITESIGAFQAARRVLGPALLGDPTVSLVAVGDGSTPRTGAMFAYRSRWQCYSVDPALAGRTGARWNAIERLTIVPSRVEDWQLPPCERAVIAAVHSHAPLTAAIWACRGAKRIDVLALPCCVPQETGTAPDEDGQDWAIASPRRVVRAWLNVKSEVKP